MRARQTLRVDVEEGRDVSAKKKENEQRLRCIYSWTMQVTHSNS